MDRTNPVRVESQTLKKHRITDGIKEYYAKDQMTGCHEVSKKVSRNGT